MYQAHVAGKLRLSGARAALGALDVPDAERRDVACAERKQKRLEELMEEGSVEAFPDALRLVLAVATLGLQMAAASSSGMMWPIRLDSGQSLLDVFGANEDAPAGIEAARAGSMTGLGVARYNDAASLEAAGANLVGPVWMKSRSMSWLMGGCAGS